MRFCGEVAVEELQGVDSVDASAVEDLLAARGARGSDVGGMDAALRHGLAHSGEQHHLADGQRGLVVLALIAERACHATTAAGNDVDTRARQQPQGLHGGADAHQRLLVAVAMQPDVHLVGREVVGADAPGLHLAHDELVVEQAVLPQGLGGVAVGRGDKVGVLVTEAEDAAGLDAHQRVVGVDEVAQQREVAARMALRQPQAPLGDGGAAALDMARHPDIVAQPHEQARQRQPQVRLVAVGELVGEQIDGALAGGRRGMALALVGHQPTHGVAAELGQGALGGEPHHALDQRCRGAPAGHSVVDRAQHGAQALDLGHAGHEPRAQRGAVAVVPVLQQLGAQAGHVDIGGTLAAAALAGEALVEHLLELGNVEHLAAAAGRQGLAVPATGEQLAQHVGAGAGRTGLVAADLVGRAHGAAHGAGLAAVAGAVALLDGAHERMHLAAGARGALRGAVVEGALPVEVGAVVAPLACDGIGLPDVVAQHRVHGQGVDNLVEVEQPVGVPALLDLTHELVGGLAILQADELAAQAAVAMLAADAAAVPLDQQGGVVGYLAEQRAVVGRLEVEDGAQVQLAGADVAIVDAAGVEALQQLPEVAHVGGQALRSHGGVLDDAGGLGVALHAAEHAQTGLAQGPHARHVGAIDPRAQLDEPRCHEVGLEGIGHLVEGLAAVGAQLGDEQRSGVAGDEEAVALLLDVALAELEDLAIHELDGGGVVAQSQQVGLEAGLDGVAVGAHDHHLAGRQGVEADLDLGDNGQGALTAGEQLAQVDGALGQRQRGVAQRGKHLVEGIAAAAAAQFGVGIGVVDELHGGGVEGHGQQLGIDALGKGGVVLVLPEGCAEALLELAHAVGLEGLDTAVGEHAHGLEHVVACAAVDQRVGAAGVVAHHAADAAAVAGGCLGAEEQAVGLEVGVELVAHHAGLDTGPAFVGVDLEDAGEVAADVGHDARTHDLTGHRGAAGAGDEVGVALAGQRQQFDDVVGVLGVGDAQWHLAVDRAVGRVGNLVQTVGIEFD